MKYINFNIIKIKTNIKKKLEKQISNINRVSMRIFPSRRPNPFNFLNGTSLKIRTNKRDRVGMGPPPLPSLPIIRDHMMTNKH